MTSRSHFGKMNSILGSVVPLAMFILKTGSIISTSSLYFRHDRAVDKDGVEYIIIDL